MSVQIMKSYGCKGISLIEVTIFVAIVGIIAAIALPSLAPSKKYQREAIAQQFADAMRYARSESIRTGKPHGFRYLTNQKRIRVFTADTVTNPATLVFDVYHPIDKQLYDYTLPSEAWTASNPIQHVFAYRDACNTIAIIYFDANGTPWCNDPNNILLDYFDLTINIGSGQTLVHLEGPTGRVTIQ